MILGRSELTRNILILATALALAAIAGCAGNDEEFDLATSIEEAYIDAQEAVEVGNYRKAIGIFEALQARFPFSDFSTQIQLELAYAYYMDHRIEQAIDAADTFIRENPTHPRIDYAIYIQALAISRLSREGLNSCSEKISTNVLQRMASWRSRCSVAWWNVIRRVRMQPTPSNGWFI